MIEKRGDKGFVLICSECGFEVKYFDTFGDALDYKIDPDNGWKSKKVNGEWITLCPDCQ